MRGKNVLLHSRIAKSEASVLVKYQEIGGRTASDGGSGFRFSLFCDVAHRIDTVVGQARGVMAKTVTINEKDGEVAFVEEGHDVERVTVILKNCYEKKHS